jgi:flagellar assembly protein FliH
VSALPEETLDNREIEVLIERRVTSEVERVRRECHIDAERLAEERYQRGWTEGHTAGRNEIQPAVEHLSRMLEDIADQRESILRDAEKIVVQLGLRVAEKIIRTEVRLQPEVVVNVVADAIRRIADKSRVVIRVNPDDADRVSNYRERLASLVGGIGQMEIRDDPTVSQGGCLVETSVETIDARFEEQLSRLDEVLIGNE